jgi:ATP-dependent Lon protease
MANSKDRKRTRQNETPSPSRTRESQRARGRRARVAPGVQLATAVVEIQRGDERFTFNAPLPLLPLRDVVVFPYMTVPLLVGRPASVKAVERAAARERFALVVTQRESDIADPKPEELHAAGTVVRLLQLFRLPDGTLRVLVEGLARARLEKTEWVDDSYDATISLIDESAEAGSAMEALQRAVLASFSDYVRLNPRIPDEVLAAVTNFTDPSSLAHAIAAQLLVKVPVKQEILEIESAAGRLNRLHQALTNELEILKLERKIEGQVRSQVHKNQREFYLNEQLKAIRKELGQQSEMAGEMDDLARQVRKARMPREVHAKALKEMERLGRMSSMSPEATVIRNYLDWLIAVPWRKTTEDTTDIAAVARVLDEDHYGLRKVKDRILEHIAVLQLTKAHRGPILCFVGPPGVGKTSLGRSIARALGRKFVRMSLGGMHDEAEIRGHRRTYIGSLPGRIVQGLKRAGTKNPVYLLDEIDKLGSDFRGDPASALLEVLDPEQNHSFTDHYLEVEFDLSKVLFLCTANVLHEIPPPLQDRMEIIRLPGYQEGEKLAIARQFLLPKQRDAAGLSGDDLDLRDSAVRALIRGYTREAGVRNLEREIAAVCRKAARRKAAGELHHRAEITSAHLAKLLGPPRFLDSEVEQVRRVGLATGLAWTEAGGDVLTIEVSILPGKGELLLTGKLGEVMRESGQAALSYARSRGQQLGLDRNFYKEIDIHVHVPEGAIPKDGPSAGIAMGAALISALTGVPTRPDVALTGEITLRGTVLPVGGILEKSVAAKRAGIKTVIIPRPNGKDLAELSPEIRRGLRFELVDTMDQVLELALSGPPRQNEPATRDEGPTLYAH